MNQFTKKQQTLTDAISEQLPTAASSLPKQAQKSQFQRTSLDYYQLIQASTK